MDSVNKKIILMADGLVGYEVCKYLVSEGEEISRLYLHSKEVRKYGDEIIKVSQCHHQSIFNVEMLNNSDHINQLCALRADYIITVYWAHLLKKEIIDCVAEGTINFHPALLPINRGWYPHVHSLYNGSSTGVTLHEIIEEADAGRIWAQREVVMDEYDTAFTLYNRLQDEIINLFKETWPKIKLHKITPLPQDQLRVTYHKKAEVNSLDKIDLDECVRTENFINLLRARSFGNKGFAYYIKNGKKVYLNIRLSKTDTFV